MESKKLISANRWGYKCIVKFMNKVYVHNIIIIQFLKIILVIYIYICHKSQDL